MSSPAHGTRPSDPAISDVLTDLALDLRWSFNHSADQLWERIDPELWEQTHNPWVVLQTVSRERLQAVTTAPEFQRLLAASIVSDKPLYARKAGFKRLILGPALRGLHISRWNSCSAMLCRSIRADSGTLPAIN